MDFENDKPIYIQLMDDIKAGIINESYLPGDRLPSIRDYAKDMMVNPNTGQKAYAELEQEGYIYSKRGIGYFVNEDPATINKLKYDYLDKEINNLVDKLISMKYEKEEIIKRIKESLWLNLKM